MRVSLPAMSEPSSPAKKPALNPDDILTSGFLPLPDLLGFGADLWEDDDHDEFLPVFDDDDDDDDDKAGKAPFAASQRPKRRRPGETASPAPPEVYDSNNESGVEDDIYARFLGAVQVAGGEGEQEGDDDDDEDEYDFLSDVDGNVELLRKDQEDELNVGRADDEEVEFLQAEGSVAYPYLEHSRSKRSKHSNADVSSPAKNTRGAVAEFGTQHPSLASKEASTAVANALGNSSLHCPQHNPIRLDCPVLNPLHPRQRPVCCLPFLSYSSFSSECSRRLR